MTTTDKPSKFIKHLTEQLHTREAEVKAANARVAKLEADLAAERADRRANLETIAELERAVITATDGNVVLTKSKRHLHEMCDDLMAKIGRNKEAIAETNRSLEQSRCRSDELYAANLDLSRRLADQLNRGAHLDAKEAELRALVAKIEQRGRAKERAEANAIMNRRALAGVVPQRNGR